MSKNIFYRIPYEYGEVNVPRLKGISKSQLQKLVVNTNYDSITFKDTSFMLEDDGAEQILFVVKHELIKGFESVYCYSVFGMERLYEYNIPIFFSRTDSHNAISKDKVDGTYDVSDIEVALENEENCNYTFFI